MKLFDVASGDMYPAGADLATQDIEFSSTPAIELADAKTTREIFSLRCAHAGDDQANLDRELEKRSDTDLQKARDQVPNTPLQGLTWHGQTAYRFGNWMCKYRLVPESEEQKRAAGEELGDKGNDKQRLGYEGMLSDSLATFHRAGEAEWIFRSNSSSSPRSNPSRTAANPGTTPSFPGRRSRGCVPQSRRAGTTGLIISGRIVCLSIRGWAYARWSRSAVRTACGGACTHAAAR